MATILVVEDGTGADPSANSYASRATIIAYAAMRGTVVADVDASDVFAIKAMDYLDQQNWIGRRADLDSTQDPPVAVVQPLDWPRVLIAHNPFALGAFGYGLAFDYADFGINVGIPESPALFVGTLPQDIRNAQCYLAMLASTGFELVPTIAGGGANASVNKFVSRQKLGPIERDFSEAVALQSLQLPFIPAVTAMLKPYTNATGPSRTYRV